MNYLFVTKQTHVDFKTDDPSTYLGAWKSAAGFVSHELRADGTYVKRKGNRPPVGGRYDIAGTRVSYQSADGGVFEGEFADGRLHQAGMIFYKVM